MRLSGCLVGDWGVIRWKEDRIWDNRDPDIGCDASVFSQ